MNNEEPKFDFPRREEEILEFWKKNKIFEESIKQRKGKKKFVFYEGPPTANGQPGLHHVEARVFKDIILRYKTMQGFYCERKAGWDTHGLPVEIQVEKELGLKNKKEIEEYGIEKFIEKCKESVWRYRNEWEKITERMAYWLDMKNAYATMANNYIETLWWIFKEIEKRKLLYEGYKILPWCPRCGTALSSHEVSQGYKKIKEESIYIKFPVKEKPNTYFLVWTTTPWTLPSNVALAINPKINYVIIEQGSDRLILAESRLHIISGEYKVGEKKLGADLIGREYEPLYSAKAPYKIFGADFVSADDGTGIVHIAPAYGEDDMNLGKANSLPVLNLADEEGKMLTPNQKWNGMFIKDADPLIIGDLKERNLLYKTEEYEHDYPFCWRCDSPLMYYAKTSWWLKTTAVKQKMIAENKKINWYPDYLKSGRFGEWLNELRDWAISRERYWGTPLPIWRCGACKNYSVVGSFDELKKKSLRSGNRYFVMRHGFAESNQKNINNSNIANEYKLTLRGRKEVLKTAQKLKREKIELIFASDFLRTKETASVVAEVLGISKENLILDEHLREINTGIFDGKPDGEYHKYFSSPLEKFTKTPPQGETLTDLKNRITQFLYEIESKYKNKNILIITHEYPTWMLETGVRGLTDDESIILKKKKNDFIKTAEVRKLEFVPLPHNQNYVLDPHRPYIDKILLKCEKCGGKMNRISGVADVWFDSGAMPFAQNHYPFIKKMEYPADYICEAIDQTRGWFFTLLADAILLGRKAPYQNVLSLGLVLDAQGQKMSKSKGNIVSPGDLMNKYGADAVRWYFYTINQPWDEKLFKESDVQAALRRFILIFWNCFTYWKMYAGKNLKIKSPVVGPKLVINKWLMARFNQVAFEAAKMLDNYDIVSAGRLLEKFVIEDISHWYIRRIREMMKNSASKEAKEVNAVLGRVIIETAKILAPFMPFISEMMYQEMKGVKKSIHLENWPSYTKALEGKLSQKLLKDMEVARDIVSKALEARTKSGIRVRQPLAALKINPPAGREKIKLDKEILELIKGEVNVKNIIFDKNIKEEIELDTTLTEELRNEGILRDLIRQIQDIRKKEGRKPSEMLEFFIATDEKGKNFIVKYAKELKKSINAKSIIIRASLEGGYETKVGELNFKIKL